MTIALNYCALLFRSGVDVSVAVPLRERCQQQSPPQALVVDGYSRDQVIDLEPYWQQLMATAGLQSGARLERAITLLETIVKFGDTMQLRDEYLLVLELR